MKRFRGCRIVKRFRGGLASQAHRLVVSLYSRIEGNEEEEEDSPKAKPFSGLEISLGGAAAGDEEVHPSP